MLRKIYLVTLLLSIAVQAFGAAPTNITTSGSLTSGGTLVITGQNFGSKSPAAPLLWDTFETGTLGAAIQSVPAIVGTWETGSGSDEVFYSNTYAYSGEKSTKNDFSNSYNSSLSLNDTFSKFYLSFKRYYPSGNGAPSNYKPFRFYGNSDTMEFFYGIGCGYAVVSLEPAGTGGFVSDSITENSWENYQITFNESSPNTANGTVIFFIDGESVYSDTSEITRTVSASLDQMRVGHYFDVSERDGCNPSDTSAVYTDDLYIDKTWARVEVCDASTWASRTVCDVQIPTAWESDGTEISCTVNVGKESTLAGRYLYVFNSSGEYNTNGILLSSEGDTTAPTVSTASIGTNGTTVTVNFSESVTTTGYDDGDFDLVCSAAGTVGLESISGTGSSRTLSTPSGTTIYSTDTCTLSFDGATDEVQDTAGNDLADFTLKAVTNNSTQTATVPPSATGATLTGVSKIDVTP